MPPKLRSVDDEIVDAWSDDAGDKAAAGQQNNADDAARAVELGDSTGVPPNIIHNNLDDFEKEYKAGLSSTIVRNNKYLIDYVNSHPLAASVSNDDWHNLDKLTGSALDIALRATGAKQMMDSIKGTYDIFEDARRAGTESPAHFGEFHTLEQDITTLAEKVRREGVNQDNAKEAADLIFPVMGAITSPLGPMLQAKIPTSVGAEQLVGSWMQAAFSPLLGAVRGYLSQPLEESFGVKKELTESVVNALMVAEPWLKSGKRPPYRLNAEIDKMYEQETKSDIKGLDKALQDVNATETRQRAPGFLSKFLGGVTKQAKVYIDSDAVRKLYGEEEPLSEDGKLGWIPDLGDKLAAAETAGDRIEVPLKDYLANVEKEIHDGLKDHIALREDHPTLDEIKNKEEEPIYWAPRKKGAEALDPADVLDAIRFMTFPGEAKQFEKGMRLILTRDGPVGEDIGGGKSHIFRLLDHEGTDWGYVDLSENSSGTSLYVNLISADATIFGLKPGDIKGRANKFGFKTTADLLRQLADHFPSAYELGGFRISGAREAALKDDRAAVISLNKFRKGIAGAKDISHAHDLISRAIGWDQVEPEPLKSDINFGNPTNFEVRLPNQDKKTSLTSVGTTTLGKALDDTGIHGLSGPIMPLLYSIKNRIQKYAKNLNIHVITQADMDRLWPGRKGTPGFYDSVLDNIVITQEALTYFGKEYTTHLLVHEGIHAVTSRLINADPKAANVVKAIMKEVTDGINNAQYATERERQDHLKLYGFTDEHEFLAEALSSKEFQTLLSKMPISEDLANVLGMKEWRKKTVFQGIVYMLQKLLALPKGKTSALEAAVRAFDVISEKDLHPLEKGFFENYAKGLQTTTLPGEKVVKEGEILPPEGSKEEQDPLEKQIARKNAERMAKRSNLSKEERDYLAALYPDIVGATPEESEAAYQRISKPPITIEGTLTHPAKQPELPGITRVEDREIFERASDIGMTVKQYRQWRALIDKKREEDAEWAKAWIEADAKRRETRQWKNDQARMREDVKTEMEQRPDIAADIYFREGILDGQPTAKGEPKPRLDVRKLTDEQKAALPEDYYSVTGMHPDDAAALFGFNSGDSLINNLIKMNVDRGMYELGPKEYIARLIDEETERRMQETYGDLADHIMESAEDNILSETQFDMLSQELLGAATKAGIELSFNKEQMERMARDYYNKMPADGTTAEKFLKLAGKAGNDAEKALLDGKFKEGFRFKQNQMFAMWYAKFAKETMRQQKQLDTWIKRWSKQSTVDPTVTQSIDPQYIVYLHDIFSRIGKNIPRLPGDLAEAIKKTDGGSFDGFVKDREHYLREVAVADFLLDPTWRKNLDSLTTEELKGVHESVKSLLHNGREDQKIYKQGEAADFAEVRKEMIEQLQTFNPVKYEATDKRGIGRLIGYGIRTYLVNHLQLESFFNRIDRGDFLGNFNQYGIIPVIDANNVLAQAERKYGKRLSKLYDGVNLREKIPESPFTDPLDFDTGGTPDTMPMRRENLRAVMLYMGSETGLQKLIEGNRVEKDALIKWVDKYATEEDWKFVQAIHDIFKDAKKENDRMYRRVSGVASENIVPIPTTNKYGSFTGGYFPLRPDPIRAGDAHLKREAAGLLADNYANPTTPSGFTKKRTGAKYPLDLSLDAITDGLGQMLQDTHMREAIINASKIFFDKNIRNAITKHFGREYTEMLKPYLQDVTNSSNSNYGFKARLSYAANFMGQNIVGTLIGWNLGTVGKHGLTALANSIDEAGGKRFAKHFATMFTSSDWASSSNYRFATETSEELQRRWRNYQENLGAGKALALHGTMREALLQIGSSLVATSDWASAVPTWLAKYEEARLDMGLDHGMASSFADRGVRRAHGSAAITSKTGIARALPPFAMLYNFWSHIANKQYEAAWRAKDVATGHKIDGDTKAKYRASAVPIIASGMAFYLFIPAIVEELVSPMPEDQRDNWAKKWGKAIARTSSSSFIGVRDLGYAFLSGRDPSVGIMSAFGQSTANVMRDLITNKQPAFSKANAGKTVSHMFSAFGMFTGLATQSQGKLAQYMINIHNGIDRPPKGVAELIHGIRFGTTRGYNK